MNISAYEIFEIVDEENNESPKLKQKQFNINIINPENKIVYSSERNIILPMKLDEVEEIKTEKVITNLQKSVSHNHISKSEV